MKSWKSVLGIGGVGAACAACCAVPLLGGAAAMTAGTGALAAAAGALLACVEDLLPVAMLLLGVAAAVGVFWWRRRWLRRTPKPALAQAGNASAASCGCPPGTCA